MKGLYLNILLIFIVGIVFSQPANDDFADAIDVSSLIGLCSADAAYDNSSATSDGSNGSCFGASGQLAGNMWFSFVATSSGEMTVTVDIGGVKGTMTRARLAIWESDGTTELACASGDNTGNDITATATGLTQGNTYYFSVDNRTGSKAGTFSLCLDEGSGSSASNDAFADAYDVTSLIGGCSSDAQYDNTGATADGSTASCYSNSFNLWFKFTAPTSGNISITIDRGGSQGDIQRVYLSLWESDGTTELNCSEYGHQDDDVNLIQSGLTPGDTYYFAVDNNNSTKSGSFTICMDDLDIFYSITDGNWNTPSTWSHDGHSGTETSIAPSSGCIVHIEGHDVTVASDGVCDSLLVDVGSDQTSLTVDANLTVESNLWFRNTGENNDAYIQVQNGGSLSATDFNINREGGANMFDVYVYTASSMSVTNLNFNSSGGSTNDTEFNIDGTGSLTISNDINLTSTGGNLIKLKADKTSSISVSNDINYICSSNGQAEIELNTSSILSLSGNFSRSSSYGIFDMNNSSTLSFVGSSQQVIPSIFGAGGDAFSYQNVTINNTSASSPQLTLSGVVYIYGQLNLTDGIVQSTSANRLYMMDNSTTINGSSLSHIEGPLTKVGNDSFTFPTGLNGDYAPIGMSAPASASDFFTAQYFQDNASSIYGATTVSTIETFSTSEYWTLDRDLGSSNVSVTLSASTGRSDSLSTMNNYIVCRWDGSSWDDHGNASYTGDYSSGTVTSSVITDFSPFVMGKTNNPTILPVMLLTFEAELLEDIVNIDWVTSSEINNDYFEVQRSEDLVNWEVIGEVAGNGTTAHTNQYSFVDYEPLEGVSYYRFKQIDYNGDYEYSMVRTISKTRSVSNELILFPNPAMSELHAQGVSENDIIRIFNVMGQEMEIANIVIGVDIQKLDISNLETGNYLLYVNGDVKKFTKQLFN